MFSKSVPAAAPLLLATAALAQSHFAEISVYGPSSAEPGGVVTAEVWGSFQSDSFIDGVSAIAGFGIGIESQVTLGGTSEILSVTIAPWASDFGSIGTIAGGDISEVSGGQLANIFGLNPNIDLSNPILLFTFDVMIYMSHSTVFEVAPVNPNPNGGLAFYPDATQGATVSAPNHPDSELIVHSWYFNNTPTPSVLSLCGLAGVIGAGPRRR